METTIIKDENEISHTVENGFYIVRESRIYTEDGIEYDYMIDIDEKFESYSEAIKKCTKNINGDGYQILYYPLEVGNDYSGHITTVAKNGIDPFGNLLYITNIE